MGYTAQRKKRIRVKIILIILIILMSVLSLFSFMDNSLGHFINQYRFQYYIISIFMVIYAFSYRFFLYSFLSLLILLLNFFVVSASVPLCFRGEDISSGEKISLVYYPHLSSMIDMLEVAQQTQPDLLSVFKVSNSSINGTNSIPQGYSLLGEYQKNSFMITTKPSDMLGYITLGNQNHAIFTSLKLKDKDYIFLSLDISSADTLSQKKAFEYLKTFVSAQDEPIIIFGNFGMTAWSLPFRKFLDENGLEVKNTLCSYFKNLFIPETQYVVGYKNLYFEKSDIFLKSKQKKKPVLFELKI